MIEMEKKLTGYPSIDKPWLKYYTAEALQQKLKPNTIYGHLFERNREHMDDIALIYFERKITYGQLFQQIESCARSLTALGVNPGDIVTIQTLAIPQTVILLYALSRVGAVANLIYVTSTESEVNHFLKHTESRLYFVLDGVYQQFSSALSGTQVEKVILLGVDTEMDSLTRLAYRLTNRKKNTYSENILSWKQFMQMEPEHYTDATVDENRPVAMVYTGGTTGVSKAVVLSNRNINAVVFQYERSGMEFTRQNIFMNSLPPFIAFGLSVSLHLPLCTGVKMVLIPDPSADSAANGFWKYRPNYYVAGPVQLEAIFKRPNALRIDFSFLKLLATGGDPLPAVREQAINDFLSSHCNKTVVVQGYGMTELAATVCTGVPKAVRFGTCGIPLPDTNIKIIDTDTGKELGYGQQGEVCIHGPSVMLGYYKEEVETSNVLKQHEDGQWWIHTGDIGSMDSDGFLTIVGRIKRIIDIFKDTIWRKIFPKLLEEQLEKVPGVQSAVVVGDSDRPEDCDLVAFIVANPDQPVTEDALRNFAAQTFADFEWPARYHFLTELPRTQLGKVDFRTLEREAQKNTEG